MNHKNLSNGTTANLSATKAPYYLYGYTFALNSGKTVQSLTLPNQGGIFVAAIDLS